MSAVYNAERRETSVFYPDTPPPFFQSATTDSVLIANLSKSCRSLDSRVGLAPYVVKMPQNVSTGTAKNQNPRYRRESNSRLIFVGLEP